MSYKAAAAGLPMGGGKSVILDDHGRGSRELAEPADADRLAARGILYGPDFIANAGGVIDGARYLFGWTEERNRTTIDAIYDTMLEILASADAQRITPAAAADRLAEARLGAAA